MKPNAVAISKSTCVTLTLITVRLYQCQKSHAAQAGDQLRDGAAGPVVDAIEARFKALGAPWN